MILTILRAFKAPNLIECVERRRLELASQPADVAVSPDFLNWLYTCTIEVSSHRLQQLTFQASDYHPFRLRPGYTVVFCSDLARALPAFITTLRDYQVRSGAKDLYVIVNEAEVCEAVTERAKKIPASPEIIAMLPRVPVEIVVGDGKEEEVECAICTEGVTGEVTKLPCGHYYHDECVCQWLRRCGNCPLCRAGITRVRSIHQGRNKMAARKLAARE